jgi:hypothetical protein
MVTSGSAMFFFYKNRGHIVDGIFETDLAIVAGDAVRAELRQPRVVDPVPDGRLALRREGAGTLASSSAFATSQSAR